MATDAEGDTTRTTVKTYVPAYQRDEWDVHAEELDMSRSEFVRSMVQAGRRGFDPDGSADPRDDGSDAPASAAEDGGSDDEDGSVDRNAFESRVLEALSTSSYLSWDELLAAVTADIEAELEETLQSLQADNVVRYSGPNGGYTIDDE